MTVIPFQPRPLWLSLARQRDFRILKNVARMGIRKGCFRTEIQSAMSDVAARMTTGVLPPALLGAFNAAMAEVSKEEELCPLWPSLPQQRDFRILKNIALALMRKRRPVAEIRAALEAALPTVGPLPPSATRAAINAAAAEGHKEGGQ